MRHKRSSWRNKRRRKNEKLTKVNRKLQAENAKAQNTFKEAVTNKPCNAEYGSRYERQVADRPSKADCNTKHLDMSILRIICILML